ncbi:MAG TPA: hypothetical protein VLE97_08980 [Gaiellaceae bacterium]|nr:hypothetical protein [Gaiellaceae bacterium]
MPRKAAAEYAPLRQLADSKYTLSRVMGELARACVQAGLWRRARSIEAKTKRLKQAEHLGEAFAKVIIDPGDAYAFADLSAALAEYRTRWT